MASHSNLRVLSTAPEADARALGLERVHADIGDIEQHVAVRIVPCLDQIFDDLLLAIDGDGAAAGQVGEIDAVAAAAEAQFDAVMQQALAAQPLAHVRLHQQVHAALLEHAGSNAMLDILAAATLDDDRLHTLQMQQVRKQQSRGSRSDDADLRAHGLVDPRVQRASPSISLSTSCAMWNAALAAGTPQ